MWGRLVAHTPLNCLAGDSSTKFEDVDLSEDWCEYDEADDVSLEVMGIEGKWEPVK